MKTKGHAVSRLLITSIEFVELGAAAIRGTPGYDVTRNLGILPANSSGEILREDGGHYLVDELLGHKSPGGGCERATFAAGTRKHGRRNRVRGVIRLPSVHL